MNKNDKHSIKNFFSAEVSKIPDDTVLPQIEEDRGGLHIGYTSYEVYVNHCYVFGYEEQEKFFLKIGKAKSVKRRFETIGAHNPKLKYFYSSPSLREEIMHALFKEKRIVGEWFLFDGESEALLKEMFNNHDYRIERAEILEKFDKMSLGGKKWTKELKEVVVELNYAKTLIEQDHYSMGEKLTLYNGLEVDKLKSQLKNMQKDLNDCYPYSALKQEKKLL